MADVFKIAVQTRDSARNKGTGTRVARRLRASGRIPAIVYGHKQTPQPISLARDDAWEILKRSTHLAELNDGQKAEMVLIREIQWDHLGKEIIHLDFSRVDVGESIETEVRIEFRGVAAGVNEGGVYEALLHDISVTCRADAIPESIRVDVSGLHLGQAIHIRDLVPPAGVTIDADPDQLVAHVISRAAEVAPTEAAAETGTQPELIRARPDEKGEEADKGKDKK